MKIPETKTAPGMTINVPRKIKFIMIALGGKTTREVVDFGVSEIRFC